MSNNWFPCNSCNELHANSIKMKNTYEAILNSVAQKLSPEMEDLKVAILEKIKIMDTEYETR